MVLALVIGGIALGTVAMVGGVVYAFSGSNELEVPEKKKKHADTQTTSNNDELNCTA